MLLGETFHGHLGFIVEAHGDSLVEVGFVLWDVGVQVELSQASVNDQWDQTLDLSLQTFKHLNVKSHANDFLEILMPLRGLRLHDLFDQVDHNINW